MGKPITREYTLALEQLYQLALDAATSARYLIKERNDENFSFVVETGINWRSISGTVASVSIRALSGNKSEITFGGGQARSSAGNLLAGQIGVIGGAVPIAKKMLGEIDSKVKKGDIPKPQTKKCPFCAEIIKVEAKVCKHCGRELPTI